MRKVLRFLYATPIHKVLKGTKVQIRVNGGKEKQKNPGKQTGKVIISKSYRMSEKKLIARLLSLSGRQTDKH